jgi:phage-related protein
MKPVHWMGSSLADLQALPEDVRSEVGFSLYAAQLGDKAMNAVPMVGFGGAKVLEVVIDEDGGTYRTIYTVKFLRAIYVLHVFQKKSKRGISTPQPDIRLLRMRLNSAERHYRATYEKITWKERGHERGA